MAILSLIDEGRKVSDVSDVRNYLARFGIAYEKWELVPEIDQNSAEDDILAAYSSQVERVAKDGGYTKIDVVNVNASTPNLDAMLAKFSAEHWHDEDEVRFTVYGRGIYHVHPLDSPVVSLEVEPGDMIRVPRGTLHWFDLCGDREIKAIRFFQDPTGWTPYYTQSTLEKQYEPVCFGPAYLSPGQASSLSWPRIID
jgi:1,2-dihydroxy-3-keto-5-methylthiopentene dioxygenase